MNLKKLLFGTPKEELARVRILEATRLRLPSGDMADATPGEEIDLDHAAAGALVADGRAEFVIPPEKAQEIKAEHAAVMPQEPTPRPMPESWAELPACFHRWHEIAERFRCARQRAADLEKAYLRETGLGGSEALHLLRNLDAAIPGASDRIKLMDGWIAANIGQIAVGLDAIRKRSKIRDALTRAYQAIDDLTQAENESLWKLHLQCGDQVIAAHGRLERAAAALSAEGIRRFRQRIAALGLGESDVARLYRNSADAAEFERECPRLHDLRLAWEDELGARHFLDVPPSTAAGLLVRFTAEAEELEAKLASATGAGVKGKREAA